MALSANDQKDLKLARQLLENPSLPARITNLLGAPIERGFAMLPGGWADRVTSAVRTSLNKALDIAVQSLGDTRRQASHDIFHRVLVAGTGAVGGAFGLASLTVELPISTTIMLRSIADIARSEGESLDDLETRLACLEVFALGSRAQTDAASETGYFAVRAIMARAIGEAAQFIAERGLAERGAPALVRLIATIAGRFGPVVTQKVAAQAIPLIGAAGGALVNTIFIDHFQDVARGHFIVRRLERVYGSDVVRREYEALGEGATVTAGTSSGLSDNGADVD